LERTKTPSDTGGENPDNPDEDDEEEPREATFGERLRASGDDLEERSDEERGKLALTEQESELFCELFLRSTALTLDEQLQPERRRRRQYAKCEANYFH
jgi:hypothetical protein